MYLKRSVRRWIAVCPSLDRGRFRGERRASGDGKILPLRCAQGFGSHAQDDRGAQWMIGGKGSNGHVHLILGLWVRKSKVHSGQEKRKGVSHGDLTAKSGDACASRTCPFAWLTWVVHENGSFARVASSFQCAQQPYTGLVLSTSTEKLLIRTIYYHALRPGGKTM